MGRDAKHYLKRGYEDVGYVTPLPTGMELYPEYLKQEVRDCASRIQAVQNRDTITFAFMTGVHYAMNLNHELRLKRTLNAYRELAARVQIDKLILGGDHTNEGCKEYKSETYRELRAHLQGITYYPVNGNHDDGTIWDTEYIMNDVAVNHLTHEEMYVLFYNHLPMAGAQFDEENPGLYYYCDDKLHKNRYIFLDTGDIPYIRDEKGSFLYTGQQNFAFSQHQIDWLVKKALHFEEEGWSVTFYQHAAPLYSKGLENMGSLNHLTVQNDILECYRTGGQLHKEYYEGHFQVRVDADFTDCIRAEVIGGFIGHEHIDHLERSESGIPYIFTSNCVAYNPPGLKCGWGDAWERRDGDPSEILFDVVTIDKKTRKIYLVRVGAGEDREIGYGQAE